MSQIETQVSDMGMLAKAASAELQLMDDAVRNGALHAMGQALRDHTEDILNANAIDVSAAREAGTSESLIDRLALDDQRVAEMADALESLASLPDPLGRVLFESKLDNGMEMKRVSVPLGVVGIIYEARPNVTADAAGICLKSGNACLLKGGSLAAHSNEVITGVLSEAAELAGMPHGCIQAISSSDRSATDAMMSLVGIIDVLIPRGGASLINHCVQNSKVPVIETGTGNCHIYVHGSADLDMATSIVMNAKCRRYGVCNAAESLLIDEAIVDAFAPVICESLASKGVLMHADETIMDVVKDIPSIQPHIVLATEEDWATEYLAPEIALKTVSTVDEAICHINHYGTKHSEAIVASDEDAIDAFLREVDAAACYANASTAFTDGGQFGFGAEIGISTQKVHVRGPFALDGLTSYKYLLKGDGQVRA